MLPSDACMGAAMLRPSQQGKKNQTKKQITARGRIKKKKKQTKNK
jgi:hypothetical protein